MSGSIEDITPHVEIEGGDESAAVLDHVGNAGEQAFQKIGTAAEGAAEHMGAIEAAAKRAGISYDEMAARVAAASAAATEGAAQAAAAAETHAQKAREAAEAMNYLGIMGAEAFAKILEAAAQGDFTGLATKLGGELAGAITKVIEVATEFIEKSATMVETLAALSHATGQTVPELIGLKDAFASVGISTSGFERAVGRLAITIANDWASIQQNVRTSADQQAGAMLRMQETAFGVQKAYQALQFTMTSTAQTAAHDALNIESASLTLRRAQEALNGAALESRQNSLSIEGAELSLRRAEMNLARDQGHKPYKEAEKALKLDQDRLAVKQAELQIEEANKKKAGEGLKAMEEELAVRKAAQALRDANIKAIEDSIKGTNELQQAQMNITKARLADREAAERQHEVDLKSIPKIAGELQLVAAGYKNWTDVTNHTEISTQNLTKALILNAAAGKEAATTKEVFEELARVLPKMGDSADAQAKKIAIMQHTMGAGFRSGQASAAQMLAVFERGPEYMHRLQQAAEQLEQSLNFKQVEKNLIAFNGSLASMNSVIDLFRAKLASVMSVPLTSFFDMIANSLKSPEGGLNKLANAVLNLVEAFAKMGVKIASTVGELATPAFALLVQVISGAINIVTKMIAAIDTLGTAFLQLTGLGDHLQGLGGVVTIIGLAFSGIARSLVLIVARLALVSLGIGALVTATGLLVQGWSKLPDWMGGGKATQDVGSKIEAAGQSISRASGKAIGFDSKTMDNLPSVYGKGGDEKSEKAAEHLDTAAGRQNEAADRHVGAADKLSGSGSAIDTGASRLAEAGNAISNSAGLAAERLSGAATALMQAAAALAQSAIKSGAPGKAGGGPIRGPGGPTDDAAGIFALSDGEYVVRTAAVAHYGVPLFEALNNMALGGFAMGGSVGGVTTPRATPTSTASSSTLNLTIDGNHFNGLSAPDHVASKLKNYAVTRQTASAGRRPSWAS